MNEEKKKLLLRARLAKPEKSAQLSYPTGIDKKEKRKCYGELR